MYKIVFQPHKRPPYTFPHPPKGHPRGTLGGGEKCPMRVCVAQATSLIQLPASVAGENHHDTVERRDIALLRLRTCVHRPRVRLPAFDCKGIASCLCAIYSSFEFTHPCAPPAWDVSEHRNGMCIAYVCMRAGSLARACVWLSRDTYLLSIDHRSVGRYSRNDSGGPAFSMPAGMLRRFIIHPRRPAFLLPCLLRSLMR